ncbi:acid protease [Coprinopsis marcescibilis]|uniref:Acid protease n=1 Tax=Coprinopsis marcescibilis TaxID=230819 RepID=A0A5C3KXB7_COPMA|nr:acid protease [Coprinopsis marcescibilis]
MLVLLPLVLLPLASAFSIHIATNLTARKLLHQRSPGLALHNFQDINYHANIDLGGQSFTVLIDTGSADLWVAGNVANSTDTGQRAQGRYAQKNVEGPVKTADLHFGDYRVPDQAFLQVQPDDSHLENFGTLGLGPSSGSSFHNLLTPPAADPVLYRLFHQNITAPNYFTILLGREKDPTDRFTGTLTVGEIIGQYRSILAQPRLNITKLPDDVDGDQHLQVLLDEEGIIGPDGEPIPLLSEVRHSGSPARPTVVFDSGFSLPQVPRSVADAIYGKFAGAQYVSINGIGSVWILPCRHEVNVSFRFGGRVYPIHPLDMTMCVGLLVVLVGCLLMVSYRQPEDLGLGMLSNNTIRGERACIGTFQPFTFERGSQPSFDMVLGMAFMRNVYTLFDYGDFVPDSVEDLREEPYVQLLSLTDPVEAHTDFVTVRLATRDDGDEDEDGDAPPASASSSRVHSAIVAAVAVVGVLIVLAGFFVYRARRGRGVR